MAVPVNNWHHQPDYDFAIAGVLFTTPEGWLIMHHRDDNTPDSPELLSIFGGRMEPEDASPAHAAAREASEETNRVVAVADITPYMEFSYLMRPGQMEKWYVYVLHNQTDEGLEVYEGQGYRIVKSANDPLLAPVTQQVVDKWFKERA